MTTQTAPQPNPTTKPEERVLCFKRSLFDNLGAFEGLSLDVERYLPVVTSSDNTFYQNRSQAEQDFTSKQLIPYIIIVKGDQILQYKRGKSGGEQRLHSLCSIGVGGHISDSDNDGNSIGYEAAMRRELLEEVGLIADCIPAVGIINVDSVEVSKVHLGVVHVVAIEELLGGSEGFEECLNDPTFVTLEKLKSSRDLYEPWSQVCIDHIDKILAAAKAAVA